MTKNDPVADAIKELALLEAEMLAATDESAYLKAKSAYDSLYGDLCDCGYPTTDD